MGRVGSSRNGAEDQESYREQRDAFEGNRHEANYRIFARGARVARRIVGPMSRRGTRILWVLITAVALLAPALGSSAWACTSSLTSQHGSAASPCAGQHGMSCCTSACAGAQASAVAQSACDAVSSAPVILRTNFIERDDSRLVPRLRDRLPPIERPPAIRFCVLRL